jgi:peptide/nickel transport system substrate-binding protein
VKPRAHLAALGRQRFLLPLLLGGLAITAATPAFSAPRPNEELLVTSNAIGRYGGRLVAALRSEPKTLNPVTAVDVASLDVIRRMTADLIHINRYTHRTEPALAKTWRVSRDGRRYTLHLRRGIRFSDGQPFDADDVVFTFQVLLDEKVHSPQRDMLVVAGKPIAARKIDAFTVEFDLPQADAAAERLFDSIAILPRHALQKVYEEGKMGQAWNPGTPPNEVAGLGPFRLKEYIPGQRIILERNPYYWKADRAGNRLPYLDEIAFLFAGSEDAQLARFQAGELDVVSRLNPENFSLLEKEPPARGYMLYDLGPGFQYEFLFFNLNGVPSKGTEPLPREQEWFRKVEFRQAVSAAIDREGIVRLVYQGRGVPLWGHVTPANKMWVDTAIPRLPRSLDRARQLLKSAGFSWKDDDTLIDSQGQIVQFSIVTNAGNSQREKTATIIQDDLAKLGMRVHVVPLEFRALTDRVFHTFAYEACLLGLVSGDADPNPEMNVWLLGGGTHLWNLSPSRDSAPWESEIDGLMRRQLTTLDVQKRKQLYDRVQQLVAEDLPLICLVSPNILVGAKNNLQNFQPANLSDYTLWNAEQLFFRQASPDPRR